MPTLGYEGSLEDFNPDDIRGKYTFEEVSNATGIPAEVLKKKFELTDEEYILPIKESGRETSLVREFNKGSFRLNRQVNFKLMTVCQEPPSFLQHHLFDFRIPDV